jgi:hypothetical protein
VFLRCACRFPCSWLCYPLVTICKRWEGVCHKWQCDCGNSMPDAPQGVLHAEPAAGLPKHTLQPHATPPASRSAGICSALLQISNSMIGETHTVPDMHTRKVRTTHCATRLPCFPVLHSQWRFFRELWWCLASGWVVASKVDSSAEALAGACSRPEAPSLLPQLHSVPRPGGVHHVAAPGLKYHTSTACEIQRSRPHACETIADTTNVMRHRAASADATRHPPAAAFAVKTIPALPCPSLTPCLLPRLHHPRP